MVGLFFLGFLEVSFGIRTCKEVRGACREYRLGDGKCRRRGKVVGGFLL